VIYLLLVGLAFIAAVTVGRTVDRFLITAAIAVIFIIVAIIAGLIVFRPPALR
jgi:predicted MFS family arabinose efflux permease